MAAKKAQKRARPSKDKLELVSSKRPSPGKPITATYRAPDKLAEAFGPKVAASTYSKHVNLICDNEVEAVMLARELVKRGWRAEADVGINLVAGTTIHAVVVNGKKGTR